MIKLLLCGFPCTKFSISQKNNRETQPYSGEGWELFCNGLLAKEKWKPDYFLFENNYSIAKPIKDAVSECLGVDHTMIDSALVSAQMRKREYWTNFDTPQPVDRGILLKDILESGIVDREKSYCLKHQEGNARDYLKKHHAQVAFGPIDIVSQSFSQSVSQSVAPIRVGTIFSNTKNVEFDSKQYRVYSPEGKSTTLCGQGGGVGAKTGLYAVPINYAVGIGCRNRREEDGKLYRRPESSNREKSNALTTVRTDSMVAEQIKILTDREIPYNALITKADGSLLPIYEVRNKQIQYKDKWYPLNVPDGFYIIRKLTVGECRRLQTVPDWYEMPCSASQNYKMFGNGWTVEVIKHILGQIPNIKNEEIQVLSMYDGMACGMIALRELGCNVVKYDAYEIDKYCVQTTKANFPEIIHHGDAFELRNDSWTI